MPNKVSTRPLLRRTPLGLVCQTCQLPRRRFASTSAPPKPPPSGLAALPSRQLLSVAGSDATKFLQGLVTANLYCDQGLPRTHGFYTGFLNATGRVLHDAFIYPFHNDAKAAEGDGFLIEADASQIEVLKKYIKRYKLRAKITLRSVTPDEVSVWQAWDDNAGSQFYVAAEASRIVLKDPRAPGLGYRVLQFGTQAVPELDLEQSSEGAYTIRRYLQGVAEGQDEILKEQALPLESNMECMNGIDFHKGCYIGQELTIRTKHRGVVRKRILPCMIYEPDKAMPQSLAYEPESASPESLTAEMIPTLTSIGRSGKKGRSAGKWLTGVGNIGLGLCRLEIMTDVVLPGEQAAATYRSGDEFDLTWGDEENKSSVKIKAFVPEWLREDIRDK